MQDRAALESALSLDSITARIEIQMLLQQVLSVNRAYLLAHPERQLDEVQQAAYRALLQRRLAGEPLAYILSEREFFGLNFKVTPATLIPRPDTELLVELALQRIPQRGRVLDLGAGSGAIALSIAYSRPDAQVTAVDASTDALEVARENARRLNIGNARFVHSDWFESLAGERYDLIVSNPPYIEDTDAHLERGDLRFEPRSALASGADGLDDIRRIVADAKAHLGYGGWLMFEHGYDQAERARGLLAASGYAEVFSARDLSGIERVSGGRYAGASMQAIR
ncbi:MAG: protein-(glutamine-N5) methyltransferase, release factor-specific [Gallionellales bacterium GWA2_60_142]|nr:MAG: protein-(glutamine-N5) methyltransferase, release factor-specific [Gallionellales bacterium GWA2_60_142]HCI13912.1 peptide chain release factor N(5)-glutamine methyltransferase [Gallionellaceae bacterium]